MWIWKDRRRIIKLKAKEIDETLEKLNVPVNYWAIFIYSIKLLIIWVLMIILTSIMNIYFLCTVIVFMEERFKKINKLLLDCLEEKKTGERINRKWPPAQLFFNVSGKFHGHIPTSQDNTNDILRIAKHLHLELCGLCGEFSMIYGIQIAVILASSIVTVIGFILSFYTIMIIPKMSTTTKILRVIFLIIRLSSIYLSVCATNISSANTVMEWEKTGRILHELETISNNKEHRKQICQFSLQIIQNPLSFTACGFVSLGYEFLHGFIGSVTTYAIIFIQMYHAPRK
ncbi:hypothetical protein PV327_005966 [Microctonus hyperodae]|uniref:Gustatory receptor n=1 Tax=Microctonus hyperodae TaxID=165561 RepID=A0AA39G2I4_MICHY|nr:hypothetical protein PV327_005966 [Microctonus hyperodae]